MNIPVTYTEEQHDITVRVLHNPEDHYVFRIEDYEEDFNEERQHPDNAHYYRSQIVPLFVCVCGATKTESEFEWVETV